MKTKRLTKMARPEKNQEEFSIEDFYGKFDNYMLKHEIDYITMSEAKIIIRTSLINRKFPNVLERLEEIYYIITNDGVFEERLMKLTKRYSVVLQRLV